MGRTTKTWYVGQKAAQTNYYAEEQAERIGFPLTHRVTINFSMTAAATRPREIAGLFSQLRRHHFNKWATRPRKNAGPAFPPTYMFAFENVRDGRPFLTMEPGDEHNVHVHWVLHIPARRVHEFENFVWEWVEEVTGGPVTGGEETIKITSNTGATGYLVKGTTPTLIKFYGRGQTAKPQGIIIGRRADTSRNLGPTARRALDREAGIRRQMPSRRSASPSGFAPPPAGS